MRSSDLLLAGPRATLKLGSVALRLGTAPARTTIRLGQLVVEDLLDWAHPQSAPGKVLRPEPGGASGAALWPRRGEDASDSPAAPGSAFDGVEANGAEPAFEEPAEDLGGDVARAVQTAPPEQSAAPAPPAAAALPELLEEPVSEEAELVAESADPGAEEGAGAQLRVQPPWPGYAKMRVSEIRDRLVAQSEAELGVLLLYERTHRARSSVIAAAEAELSRR
jgi:hypothetical protein